MARIRRTDTGPEVELRKALHAAGLRYRRQLRIEGITADVVFVGARLALFVDGCQWHGCPDHYVRPRSRTEFWAAKLATNVARDIGQRRTLSEAGWRVLHIWEHELREDLAKTVRRVQNALAGEPDAVEDWRVQRVEVIDPETDLERRIEVSLGDNRVRRAHVRRRTTRKVGRVEPGRFEAIPPVENG